MKQSYVPTTLNEFLNESKSFVLKRKYGERQPISVGSTGPIRNQILSYVNENQKVSRNDLRKFILGLNEGKARPAAASMWIKRNEKYFVTESKNGVTYYKLSDLGRRLATKIQPAQNTTISESFRNRRNGGCGCGNGHIKPGRRMNEDCTCDDDEDQVGKFRGFGRNSRFTDAEVAEPTDEPIFFRGRNRNEEPEESEEEIRPRGSYRRGDFTDKRTGKPGLYDRNLAEEDEPEEPTEEHKDFDDDDDEIGTYLRRKQLDRDMDESFEARRRKVKRIVENIRNRRAQLLKEEEEAKETEETEKEPLEEKKEKEEEVETPEEPTEEPKDKSEDDETKEYDDETKSDEDEDENKVEITEFVITVDNADDAIKELEDKKVVAEKVIDEDGNEIEGQIKVSAEYWDDLKSWLEDKGVNIEEMFGGEISTEDNEETSEPAEEPTEDKGSDEDILSFLNDDNEEENKEPEEPKE